MKFGQLRKNGVAILPRCFVARSFVPRLLGLMSRKGLADTDALLFPRCNSVHTFFMRFVIDVVFLDSEGIVVEVRPNVVEWRLLMPVRGVAHTLELGPGRAAALGIQRGDRMDVENLWPGRRR